jgi:hypothetical protein
MKLPNGDQAIVEDRKLVEYVLNAQHPVGKHHAVLFRELLGIGPHQAPLLKAALSQAAREAEAVPSRPSLFGKKYELRLTMTGAKGDHVVLAIWLIERGAEVPRLITCYVE